MNAWYLYHSGFAVETAEHFLIFDYYRDAPRGGGLSDGVIDPGGLRDKGKRVVAFASHAHHDHYNPVILEWKTALPDIRYVLSDDIPAQPGAAMMKPGETLDLGDLSVRTLPSTDEGVAFLVKCGGICVYHAGDLNWWHWNGETDAYNRSMEKHYTAWAGRLRGERIDLAFLPLDPRLEDKYLWGLDWFMREVGARYAAPMHFWEDESVFARLRADPRCAPYRERVLGPYRRGEQILPEGV